MHNVMGHDDNIILNKTYQFALKIITLYKYLTYNKKEYELAKQILRCGTSIGANSEEAVGAQSKKDFIAKFSIAYKEARETHYWLRLLKDGGFIDRNMSEDIMNDCEEIKRIISSILISSKKNN